MTDTRGASRARGLRDLILVDSWRGSLLLIVGAVTVLFFVFGFWWPYWRIADMDLWMIYEALLQNDGLAQEWFDHPGYLTILLLGDWFRLLHAVGLLDVHAFSAVPASTAGAEHAWTAAARAGRVLSLILSDAYVVVFGALVLRIVKDWRIAVLAAFALAFSGGLEMSARIMRTELLAGAGVTIALLLLILAGRAPRPGLRPLLVGAAALFATLGLINKVQVIFLIGALPVLALAFGCRSEADAQWWTTRRGLVTTALLAVGSVLVAIPAGRLILVGYELASSAGWKPFLLVYGSYQVALAIWVAAALLAYALIWRVSVTETVATALLVVIGVSLGLLTLDIRYNPQNVLVVVNPLEQLFTWAKNSNPELSGFSSVLRELAEGLRVVLVTRTFVLDTSARPTIFLEWLAIALSIFAWRAGQRQLVLQAVLLIAVAWGMDAMSAVRGLKQQYFILTDPLIVIAAALLLAGLPALHAGRYVYPIGLVLIVAHVAISLAEPIKHSFLTSKPLAFCVQHFGYTRRVEQFSFCAPTSMREGPAEDGAAPSRRVARE